MGKVELISSSNIELVNCQRFAGAWDLCVFLRSGTLHHYSGFKESVSKSTACLLFCNGHYLTMFVFTGSR